MVSPLLTYTILDIDFVEQMVLINPHIAGEKMIVSFPPESGCADFEVPLNPEEGLLSKWEMSVIHGVNNMQTH